MSFLPFDNFFGFGASDVLELVLAALLIILILVMAPWFEPWLVRFANRTFWCMLVLAILPVMLRLILLPNHPVPSPDVYDEFGHLFVADTLRHFRLANPSHPMHRFFETFFVLQEPTYSSIYPLGQGIALAFGRMLFGNAWAGVLLSAAALCSLTYWMLRGWVAPIWALLGGIFAVFQFGPLCQWMNGYWGGSFAGAAGCLVFGALPRLRPSGQLKYALLLGLGTALSMLVRPYECVFLVVSIALYVLPGLNRKVAKALAIATLVALPALGLTLLQDQRVTGHWMTLPYSLSQYQYGVPASLTFQPDPQPHRDLTPQQELEYQAQMTFTSKPETVRSFLLRLEYRVRFYRFFFLPPLFLALPFFIPALRELRFRWVAVTLILFALGINFFPAFQLHYLASISCLFILVSVTGLERLNRMGFAGSEASRLIIFLCVIYFGFWYTMHLFDQRGFSRAMRQYETWDGINHRNPERRIDVNRQLANLPGKLLVFVRYSPQHVFQDEWVYNAADIDGARVVWARDLGAAENEQLLRYYPDRAALLLEPDNPQPELMPYR